jgi:RecA-family ATPase
MTAQLLPDVDKLGRFADAVFRHADPKGYVSARVFHDKGSATKDDKPITVMPISLGDPQFDSVMLECARQAAQFPTAAVFCPPVVTFKDGKSARAENVLEGVTLTVDCDQSPRAARATLSRILGHPTIVVASGGEWINPDTGKTELKTHLHWRLKVPAKTAAEHERLREARSVALRIVGGDPSAAPPVHPLRWPGSWHRKGEPKLADIVLQTDNEIDLLEALAMLRESAGSRTEDLKFSRESDLEAENPDDVAAALRVIPNENLDWATWNNIGLAIYGATGGSEYGAQAWADWSAKAAKNDAGVTAARWEHFHRSPPSRCGFGTLVYLARQHAPNWTPTRQAEMGEHLGEPQEIAAPLALAPITPAMWKGTEPVKQRWLATARIPSGDLTILAGNGGSGKTEIAIQLLTFVAAGLADWLGCTIENGLVLLISCEEPEEDIRNRVERICKYRDLDPHAIDQLHMFFPELDATWLGTADRAGRIAKTPLLVAIEGWIEQHKPRLVVIDSIAAVFDGEAIQRRQVRAFLAMLRKIARQYDAAILLLDHPSVRGMADGTGTANSVDWRNSVRSMLHLSDPEKDDPDARELEVKKNNRGRIGEKVQLRWNGLTFTTEAQAVASPYRAAAEREVDELFLRLLDKRTAQGRPVRPNKGASYAPSEFADDPDARGITFKAFAASMDRLYKAGKLVTGKNARGSKHIERAT